MISIYEIGLSHKTAPIEIREKVAFSKKKIAEGNVRLQHKPSILENLILSTCNRTEIYFVAKKQSDFGKDVQDFLSEYHNIPVDEYKDYLTLREGKRAISHLFRVASSIDSMVIGENQIISQIKEAITSARLAGSMNKTLEILMNKAQVTAKRVRTETRIALQPVSVSSVAVDMAKKIFGELTDKKSVVIGGGEMGELAVKYFYGAGADVSVIAHKHRERAEKIAAPFNAAVHDYDRMIDEIARADVVISSTSAPHYIITPEKISEIMRKRNNAPIFFIDIALPRDIDPALNDIDNVYLYNTDELTEICNRNLQERKREISLVEEIIAEETENFIKRFLNINVEPLIQSIYKKYQGIRKDEVKRILGDGNGFSKEQIEKIEYLTESIMKKILHDPVTSLKKTVDSSGHPELKNTAEILFRMDE